MNLKKIFLFILALSLELFLTNCKSTTTTAITKESQCTKIKNQSWLNGQCYSSNYIAVLEAECQKKGEVYVNGVCKNEIDTFEGEARCLAQKNVWKKDAKTGFFACFSSKTIQSSQEFCEKEAGAHYDLSRSLCLTLDGQRCEKGGDIWTEDGCLTKLHASCEGNNNGDKWDGTRCISAKELECSNKEAIYMFDLAANTCRLKSFLDYCKDETNIDPVLLPGLKEDLVVIKKYFKSSKCDIVYGSLSGRTSLTLTNVKLKTLFAIRSLKDLKALVLDDNLFVTLDGISDLVNLSTLTISGNQLTNLNGIQNLPLKTLSANNNQISDLSALETVKTLEKIYLSGNKLTTTESLDQANQPNLNYISLQNNCTLQDIDSLGSFQNLKILNLQRIGIAIVPDNILARSKLNKDSPAFLDLQTSTPCK